MHCWGAYWHRRPTKSAWYSSKNPYIEEVSEFEATEIESEYLNDTKQPFVKESPVRILCKYVNEYKIEDTNKIPDIILALNLKNESIEFDSIKNAVKSKPILIGQTIVELKRLNQ